MDNLPQLLCKSYEMQKKHFNMMSMTVAWKLSAMTCLRVV